MRSLNTLFFILLIYPLCSFQVDSREKKNLIRKWRVDDVKLKTRKLFSIGEDMTKRYAGDELSFFEDGTVTYFKKSQNITYKGTWKFGFRSSSQMGTGNPQSVNGRRVVTTTGSLEMDLTGPSNQRMRIIGSNRSVSHRKLFYVVDREDGPCWFYWVPVEDDGEPDTAEDN